jgi:hypothetical protein
MSKDSSRKTPHMILSELEEAVNTHITILKGLRTAFLRLKRGEQAEKYLESKMRAVRRIRNEILQSLKNFEDSEEPIDEELASEIVAMVMYIEMSAIKDEKRYLLVARRLLERRGAQLDIEEDLKKLEEMSRSARRVIEKYTKISSGNQ